jgi:hypothetical protein
MAGTVSLLGKPKGDLEQRMIEAEVDGGVHVGRLAFDLVDGRQEHIAYSSCRVHHAFLVSGSLWHGPLLGWRCSAAMSLIHVRHLWLAHCQRSMSLSCNGEVLILLMSKVICSANY